MEAFLKLVADDLFQKYGEDIHQVCLVFPGRRASVFFNKYLADRQLKKPIWMPTIRTISELFSEISGLQLAKPLLLNFELFKVYQSFKQSEETFDDFFAFGEMLIGDFSDVDKYLVNARQLFQNLSDFRDIDVQFSLSDEQIQLIQQFWKNISIKGEGSLKRDFISIWNRLFEIYQVYNTSLLSQNIAYEGMLYRNVCAKIAENIDPQLPFGKFAIIGFNALNECEKLFFNYLKKEGKAHFYWDYDNYYLENRWHEAGFFIRENLENFPNELGANLFNGFRNEKNIKVYAVSTDVGQAKILPEILQNTDSNNPDKTDTVIVLGDEQLLIPVLGSVPEEYKNVNISLGYPLKLTPVQSFIEALIKCYKSSRIIQGNLCFYHRDILSVINHPYIQISYEKEGRKLEKSLIEHNKVFVKVDELTGTDIFSLIFQKPEGILEYLDYIQQIIQKLMVSFTSITKTEYRNDFNLEYWFVFITELNSLSDIILKNKLNFGIPILFKLLRKIISVLSIPFKGEPLVGLQIMGVLETRAIDFKNVIFLSLNEGIFPKTEASPTYIPYKLRKGFGLPTIEHQDAIYAYYFYRLLQRSNNIHLVYNTQTNSSNSEMSRYIYQLKYENKFQISETGVGFSISIENEKEISIPKKGYVYEQLNKYNTTYEGKTLTPTALSTFMDCSLKFYFRYIAKIEEKEEISEDIDGSLFGKIIHSAMEWLYKPYLNNLLTKELLIEIEKETNIDEAIMYSFGKEYFKTNKSTEKLHGKSLIIKEIVKKYIKRIFEIDKNYSPFTILSLETKYETLLKVSENLSVNIGGYIDRLDRVENSIRIIDYKTGKAEYSVSALSSLFDREGDPGKYSAIFQSVLYAIVINKQSEFQNQQIYPGLYSLRKIFDDSFSCILNIEKQPVKSIDIVKEKYTELLNNVVTELFNTQVPFTKTSIIQKCEHCPYAEICQR